MAFAARSLRISLFKINNVSCTLSSLRLCKPVERINVISASHQSRFLSTGCPSKFLHQSTSLRSSTASFAPGLEKKPETGQNNDSSKEEEEDRKQREHKRKMMNLSFITFGCSLIVGGSVIIYELIKPSYDSEGNVIEDEFSNLPFFQRSWSRLCRELKYYKKFVEEPSSKKLLPDPVTYPYIQPPYTLVLELKDLLVHPVWTYESGWRFKKRPGLDQFLETLASPLFEIVVYSAESGMTLFPLMNSLDPKGHIMYKLARDSTYFIDGHHVKELNYLNRDLKKVIAVDWDPNSVKFHPENALVIPRWSGNDDDTGLYDLAAFLQTIYATEVEDVRDVLTYYRQFDKPLEVFRENQRKLSLQMEEDEMHKKQMSSNKSLATKWTPSFLRFH